MQIGFVSSSYGISFTPMSGGRFGVSACLKDDKGTLQPALLVSPSGRRIDAVSSSEISGLRRAFGDERHVTLRPTSLEIVLTSIEGKRFGLLGGGLCSSKPTGTHPSSIAVVPDASVLPIYAHRLGIPSEFQTFNEAELVFLAGLNCSISGFDKRKGFFPGLATFSLSFSFETKIQSYLVTAGDLRMRDLYLYLRDDRYVRIGFPRSGDTERFESGVRKPIPVGAGSVVFDSNTVHLSSSRDEWPPRPFALKGGSGDLRLESVFKAPGEASCTRSLMDKTMVVVLDHDLTKKMRTLYVFFKQRVHQLTHRIEPVSVSLSRSEIEVTVRDIFGGYDRLPENDVFSISIPEFNVVGITKGGLPHGASCMFSRSSHGTDFFVMWKEGSIVSKETMTMEDFRDLRDGTSLSLSTRLKAVFKGTPVSELEAIDSYSTLVDKLGVPHAAASASSAKGSDLYLEGVKKIS